MVFYIVSSVVREKIRADIKDNNVLSYSDLEEAISDYCRFNRERKFKHSYLLADFERLSKAEAKKVQKCSEDDESLPYLMIGEYHHNYADPDYAIRKDKLIIRNEGIDMEYENNLDAMRAYLGLLRKGCSKLELFMEYLVDRFGKTGIKTQLVATYKDDEEIALHNPVKKLEIEPITWEPAPIEAKKMYLYDLRYNDRIHSAMHDMYSLRNADDEIELFPI